LFSVGGPRGNGDGGCTLCEKSLPMS
jgi:hypothetical protein